jgi:hypothetical protein
MTGGMLMKRDLPVMAMTMDRATADAERFFRSERHRISAEMKEAGHTPVKPSRVERRAGEKESYEARLRKRLKSHHPQ